MYFYFSFDENVTVRTVFTKGARVTDPVSFVFKE